MIYAFLIEGLDAEGRADIDRALEGDKPDPKAKARRQRAALAALRNVRE